MQVPGARKRIYLNTRCIEVYIGGYKFLLYRILSDLEGGVLAPISHGRNDLERMQTPNQLSRYCLNNQWDFEYAKNVQNKGVLSELTINLGGQCLWRSPQHPQESGRNSKVDEHNPYINRFSTTP